MTHEFKQLFEEINKDNRPGLTTEQFVEACKRDVYYRDGLYLEAACNRLMKFEKDFDELTIESFQTKLYWMKRCAEKTQVIRALESQVRELEK